MYMFALLHYITTLCQFHTLEIESTSILEFFMLVHNRLLYMHEFFFSLDFFETGKHGFKLGHSSTEWLSSIKYVSLLAF